MLGFDLPVIWAALIFVAVVMYMLLDGFDLGIGILFPFLREESDRDAAMASAAPIWDGNETWLVFGGGGFFAAFPKAFALFIPAVYIPITLMLVALVFRGVAFEFRAKAAVAASREGTSALWSNPWNAAFHFGSLVATFAQGLVLGTYLQGVPMTGPEAGTGSWLSPFSLLCGLTLVAGYGLLGACWLVVKTSGDLQGRARRFGVWLTPVTLILIALISLGMLAMDPAIAARWLSPPTMFWLAPVPILTLLLAAFLVRRMRRGAEKACFAAAAAMLLLGIVGLTASVWPYLVPPELTISEAAAAPNSQMIMLIGVLIVLPVILAYTAYVYWVFRGKVDPSIGYH